jgi:cephalosporin hydroxylase
MKQFDQLKIILEKLRTRNEELKTRWRMVRSIQRAVRSANRISDQFTAESAIKFLYSDQAREIRPWQYREELELLAKEIEKKQPRTILEIGTASGGTLFLASRLTGDDALIISIDLPDGEFGGGYPTWKSPLYHSFKRENQTMELIRGNSHTDEVFYQVANCLGGRFVDYLFLVRSGNPYPTGRVIGIG